MTGFSGSRAVACWRRRLLQVALVVLGGLAWPAQAAVTVVASFSILADLVRAVGGDAVTVTSLVEAGQDGHVFQPRPSDLTRLRDADLVVINGLGFEGWLTRLIQSAGYRGPLVVASRGVTPLGESGAEAAAPVAHGHAHDETHTADAAGTPDPHAWQDPTRVLLYIDNITAGLAGIDPANAAVYHQRAAHYKAELQALDAELRQQLAAPAGTARAVVTPHAAMAYFAQRYGIEFIAAQGASTASEPGGRELAELIRRIRGLSSVALFTESQGVPAILRQVARETGLPVSGRLYSDTLSPPDGPASTYLDMMRYNAHQVQQALQTKVTPR